MGSNNTAGAKLSELAGPLVCFAVKEEAAPLRKNLSTLGGAEILITGIGKKNSEQAVERMLDTRTFSLVLTCGFAGALNPDFKVGDVLFDEDPEAALADLLRASDSRPAKFHCAARVAISATEKIELRRNTGADVVEMESGVIRKICRAKKIPSATVRVISDTAHEDLPLDFNSLMTPEQTISYSRLAVALLKSPEKVPRMMELQRNTRFAAEKLAEVLSSLLRSLNSRARGSNPGLGTLV